jgi:hypothetical protein
MIYRSFYGKVFVALYFWAYRTASLGPRHFFFWTSENVVGTSASKNSKTDTKNYFSERNYWVPLGDAPICFV